MILAEWGDRTCPIRTYVVSGDSVAQLDCVPDMSLAESQQKLLSALAVIGNVYLFEGTNAKLAEPEEETLFL